MNKQTDRMKLNELQNAIEDAEQQEQQQEETAVRSEQERKQLVDAIVKAVSKDFLDTQVRLAEGIEKCFNQLNKSIAERISYMAKAVIADFHKNRIHPDDFEKLKKEVAELKELSQSGVKIAQRIDKRREVAGQPSENTTFAVLLPDNNLRVPDTVLRALYMGKHRGYSQRKTIILPICDRRNDSVRERLVYWRLSLVEENII